jgi:hypothetical protein
VSGCSVKKPYLTSHRTKRKRGAVRFVFRSPHLYSARLQRDAAPPVRPYRKVWQLWQVSLMHTCRYICEEFWPALPSM